MTKNETAWVWLCDFGMCKWAEPTRKQLVARSKPSPEAKPIKVEFVPTGRYRKVVEQSK